MSLSLARKRSIVMHGWRLGVEHKKLFWHGPVQVA